MGPLRTPRRSSTAPATCSAPPPPAAPSATAPSYQISPNGVERVLYSFTGGADGGEPMAGLLSGGNGAYYGTTSMGGINDAGTIFQIATAPAN